MIRRILKYLQPYTQYLILLIISTMLVAVLSLADAGVVGFLTDAIFYRTKGLTVFEKPAPENEIFLLLSPAPARQETESLLKKYFSSRASVSYRATEQGTIAAIHDPAGVYAENLAKDLARGFRKISKNISVFTLTPFRYLISEAAANTGAGEMKKLIARAAGVNKDMIEIHRRDDKTSGVSIYFINPTKGLEPVRLGQEIQNSLRRKDPEADVSYLVAQPKPSKRWALFPKIYTIFLLPFALLIIYLIKGIFVFAQFFLSSYVGQKVIANLRENVYIHLQALSLNYFERKMRTGQIISRIVNDISLVQYFLTTGIVEMLLEPTTILFGMIAGFYIHWKLALGAFILIPLIALPISRISRLMRKISLQIQNKTADITNAIQETVNGIRIVKAFNMEDHVIQRFKNENWANFRALMRGARLTGILTPLVELAAASGLAIFVWYGGSEVIQGNLRASELIAFFFIMGLIANPVKRLSRLFGQIQHSFAAMERIFEVLDQVPDIQEPRNAKPLPGIEGAISFVDVDFAYDENGPLVLKDINLQVKPGEIVAIIGPSGSGKTSLINLILRFYDPVRGRILVDGHDIRSIKLSSLRKQIGLVSQETILFRGTVAENILFGKPDATMEEVIAAAKIANAHSFIVGMPQGYDSMVGEKGSTLSGGQRQRIAIARAVLRDPKILILDEATSALDAESEMLVQEALEKLLVARTTFIIAHRLSTIRKANRIVVLNDGKIVETGSHAKLMKLGGLYKALYETQFERQTE